MRFTKTTLSCPGLASWYPEGDRETIDMNAIWISNDCTFPGVEIQPDNKRLENSSSPNQIKLIWHWRADVFEQVVFSLSLPASWFVAS